MEADGFIVLVTGRRLSVDAVGETGDRSVFELEAEDFRSSNNVQCPGRMS